jgi:hypothetical protein
MPRPEAATSRSEEALKSVTMGTFCVILVNVHAARRRVTRRLAAWT